ncbi:hypothetical protein GGR57DRAFT_516633 [Xylariaceae sp. FL1272]|nr:hypothetical protein GGR57DRAFT_516633 [Xylariaceae sp. FL1272]
MPVSPCTKSTTNVFCTSRSKYNGSYVTRYRNITHGVQDEGLYGISYEFQLHGLPWRPHGDESITSRRLVTRLLAALFAAGWVLEVSVDISRKGRDFDTLLFRQQDIITEAYDWFCLSFMGSNLIRLIDVPEETEDEFQRMLKHKRWLEDGLCWVPEFESRGHPWAAKGQEAMRARLLLLDIRQFLEAFGWTVYASIAHPIEDFHSRGGSMDTWHCRRAQN